MEDDHEPRAAGLVLERAREFLDRIDATARGAGLRRQSGAARQSQTGSPSIRS
jgi:hypothetical protein